MYIQKVNHSNLSINLERKVEMYSEVVTRNQKRSRKQTYTLRFYVVVKGKKRTANFKLTGKSDPLLRDHQHLTNLFYDIEDRQKDGGSLNDESKATIRGIRMTNPDLVNKWIDENWFADVSVLTLEQAFEERIQQMRLDKLDERTCKNWTNTGKRIFRVIKPTTPVTTVDLKLVKRAFGELRNLVKSDGEPYSTDTIKKDASNLRVLFQELEDHNDIPKNTIRKFQFKVPKHLKPEPKPTISQVDFLKVLDQFKLPEEIEQYTLLIYYRLMSARQNDPKHDQEKGNVGDHWQDVDFDRKTINRWNIKTKSKIGHAPCNEFMWKALMAWHDHVVNKHGKAEGPIFPWLNESTSTNQRKFFKVRIKDALGVWADWKGVSQTLRCNRSRDLRRMKNGNFMESKLVGHSEEVASQHYDDIQADQDFPQIWNEENWNLDDEGEAA
tara:strand:- start:479 stop:1798 length:1320 start_codon:yes stop_codon:yes gene_type:complete